MTFTATYDACVLHPASVRDLLVRLAMTGLFRAVWSAEILDEMVRSVIRRYPDITPEQLERTTALMCKAVPDSLVSGYEPLVEGLELPDTTDRHVLAVAIRSGSQVIVTENLKDFPEFALAPYGIEAQSPDLFVLHLLDLAPSAVSGVVQQQAADLANPPMSVAQLLDRLTIAGLPRAVAALRDH